MIYEFRGKYNFLSNFSSYSVKILGNTFPSSENAYQHAKLDKDKTPKEVLRRLLFCSAADAKKLGNSYPKKENWDEIKIREMEKIIRSKFKQNRSIRVLLVSTGDHQLVEGNWWHDNFWGDCHCSTCCFSHGENNLGKILMKIREEFRPKKLKKLRGEKIK